MDRAIERLNLIQLQLQQDTIQERSEEFPMLPESERKKYSGSAFYSFAEKVSRCNLDLVLTTKNESEDSEAVETELKVSEGDFEGTNHMHPATESLAFANIKRVRQVEMAATESDQSLELADIIDEFNDTILVMCMEDTDSGTSTLKDYFEDYSKQMDYLHIERDVSTGDIKKKCGKKEHTIILLTEECLEAHSDMHEYLEELKSLKKNRKVGVVTSSDQEHEFQYNKNVDFVIRL